MNPNCLWLALVTPFRDGELDAPSLRRLVRHYANAPVDGLILAATSGEGMTLSMRELERLVMLVRAELDDMCRHVPFCVGLSGAATGEVREALDETAAWPIDFYLIASPYYVRPSQRGLLQHFTALADHAAWPIVPTTFPTAPRSTSTMTRCWRWPNIPTSWA
jgi:4-hydroxy-tetrahydrodipicolinate synthase